MKRTELLSLSGSVSMIICFLLMTILWMEGKLRPKVTFSNKLFPYKMSSVMTEPLLKSEPRISVVAGIDLNSQLDSKRGSKSNSLVEIFFLTQHNTYQLQGFPF